MADPHQLREDAASAVARGKFEVALALYGELEQLEPTAAAWPKRVGETHRRMGDPASAVLAFERAVDKYVHDGLLVQAIAVCKLILQIDPQHASTAERLSELATPTPAEARAVRLRRPPEGGAESITSPASRAELLDAPFVARVPTVTPSELARRAGNRRPVTLPPGGGLDAIPLAMVMPDSQRVVRDDGTDAGMSVLRIEVAFDEVDDEVEIEIVDPRRMALLKTPVFAELPAEALEALIGQLELRDLYNGEEVFHEGDAGTTMFVISEGEVEVAAHGKRSRHSGRARSSARSRWSPTCRARRRSARRVRSSCSRSIATSYARRPSPHPRSSARCCTSCATGWSIGSRARARCSGRSPTTHVPSSHRGSTSWRSTPVRA